MTAPPILEALEGLPKARQVRPGAWAGCCPAHEDRTPSLSWTTGGEGQILVKCQAGCQTEAVMAALGATLADLFAPRANGAIGPARQVEATYDYRDESGTMLYQVIRYHPKDFRQKRADGAWTMDGVRRVLYRLPELVASDRGAVVVEGEKDADRLASLGLVATCNAGGAGKWRPEYAEMLRGRRVVIVPDNDGPGRDHAADVARSLIGVADVRLLNLPGLASKGDVSDWLDAGHTADELRLALLAAPPFAPAMPHGAEWVGDIDLPEHDPAMALPPMILDEGPTILFGMGETHKSILAQIIATSIATGREIVPGWLPTLTAPVAWLDYESGRRRFARRQRLLGPAAIVYVPCSRPIWDDTDALAGLVADVGAGLVVVDSIVPASAGGAISTKDAETAGRYFGAVNAIAPRSLSIGHVTKDGEATMPFGSVFFHNLARLTWRTKADEEGRVMLTNHKHTDGDRLPATTLRLDFGDRLTVSHVSAQLTTEVLSQIVAETGPVTGPGLADAVKAAGYVVGRSWLLQLAGRAVEERLLIRPSRGRYGPGTGQVTGQTPL